MFIKSLATLRQSWMTIRQDLILSGNRIIDRVSGDLKIRYVCIPFSSLYGGRQSLLYESQFNTYSINLNKFKVGCRADRFLAISAFDSQLNLKVSDTLISTDALIRFSHFLFATYLEPTTYSLLLSSSYCISLSFYSLDVFLINI